MNIVWLYITSVLAVTSAASDQKTDINIRVFPALNRSIAGVFQVTHLNFSNQPHYAFNASEARQLCQSLGVDIASKAQVQKALARGLETCRFGWTDEHFAVIPRIQAVASCGQNKKGLVTWRASVERKFDVFCFNESDAATQWKDTETDSPLSSSDDTRHTQSFSQATQTVHTASSLSFLPSSTSTPETSDNEPEPARFVDSAQRSAGGKVILITCTCGLLVGAAIILAYLKLQKRCSPSSDEKQQQEYIETEEWTCVKSIKETKKDIQEDERIEVGE